MRKTIHYLLFLVIITACTLPPNPPPPGLGGGYGAAAAGTAYSDGAGKLIVSPQEIIIAPSETANLAIQVNAQDVVYKYGYIYKSGKWERFEFSGKPVPNSDWLQDARATAQITLDAFPPGRNLVIAYGCKHTGDTWNCNENKWMISFFTVTQRTTATSPPPPPPPVTDTSQTIQTSRQAATSPECADSDDSAKYDQTITEAPRLTPTSRPDAYSRGKTTYVDSAGLRQTREDQCLPHASGITVLVERACAVGKKDVVTETVIRCPTECKNGACVMPPGTIAPATQTPAAETKQTAPAATCTDSDNGNAPEKSGRVVATWTENSKPATFAGEDNCLTITNDNPQLVDSCKTDAAGKTTCNIREHYCTLESKQPYAIQDKQCPNGCDKGACLPAPTCSENQGKPCGCENKGVTNCDGTCSVPVAPENFGKDCNRNSCGGTGTVKCDGTCSATAPFVPVNFGQACNCGGTIGCDGQCTKPACGTGQACQNGQCVSSCSPQQGQACNRNACGGAGTVQCDGSCSSPAPFVPVNLGQACNRNSCGGSGTIDCSGGCNQGPPFQPFNLGQACGCGGTIQCSGQCSANNCPSGTTCQNGRCVGCEQCILAPSQNCDQACIAHGQASKQGFTGGYCANPGSTNTGACCSCTCNGQTCGAGQVCIGGSYCGAPCSGCLGGASDCTSACGSLRAGYTRGECIEKSSTNPGSCCACYRDAPTYTAPTYTAPTSNCRSGSGTCRMQNGCPAYMHQVWTNGNLAQGCTNVYSIINTRVCGTTPGGIQCDGSSSTSIYRDQCVCP